MDQEVVITQWDKARVWAAASTACPRLKFTVFTEFTEAQGRDAPTSVGRPSGNDLVACGQRASLGPEDLCPGPPLSHAGPQFLDERPSKTRSFGQPFQHLPSLLVFENYFDKGPAVAKNYQIRKPS